MGRAAPAWAGGQGRKSRGMTGSVLLLSTTSLGSVWRTDLVARRVAGGRSRNDYALQAKDGVEERDRNIFELES